MTLTALQPWILASRPRTLLLATASIAMGGFLAAQAGRFNPLTTVLIWLTATLLQILSNLANDYGDARHGIDQARIGPTRAVQAGLISSRQMLAAVVIVAALSVISGSSLLIYSLGLERLAMLLVFLLLGGLSIWAAVAYTATDKPYGYIGLGDVMVFMFFGWLAVLGTSYLQTLQLNWTLLLPASSSGLLAVAVLNINNIRDLQSDQLAGKRSVAVRLGARGARVYHGLLLILAALMATLYTFLNYSHPGQFLYLLAVPLLLVNVLQVWRRQHPEAVAPLLKQMSLTTVLFTLLFGIGLLFSR